MSKPKANGHAIRFNRADRIYYCATSVLLTIITLSVLYPLIYILSASFSAPDAVMTGKVFLWPVNFSLRGYEAVFSYKPVFVGYRNTIFYTVAGTVLNVVMTTLAAYPLSRRDLVGGSKIMLLFTFTMIFSGGMIPNYLLISGLKMTNTVWAMLIPGVISVYNMIIMRTFFSSLSTEILEAAKIDGCSDSRYLVSIVLPLSKAVLAVVSMYYAVTHWNSYFKAFLYLNDMDMFPLQLYLRQILVLNSIDSELVMDPEMQQAIQGMYDLLKYSLIVVSTVPILCVYPFAQRYFVKGVMIGSVKG